VLPAWMIWAREEKKDRLARFAREVFCVTIKDNLKAAIEGTERLKAWFVSIGAPVTLKDARIPENDIEKITDNALNNAQMWGMTNYTKEVIAEILAKAK
ncbi:MAG TPA: iron-containing alcohol dehydrogenase, partial [Smithellaceae bacterium]|nr:iron-containing alcohol dehydrogenase [Smithellaceae bacterium]HPY34699.1 iron-containing alcohol dehydrogenase [Smithellaceae bacterium]